MSKTLAELRQSKRVGLPERTYQLCLAPKLVGEVQELISQLEDAEIAAEAQRSGDKASKPKRVADKSPVADLRAQLAALRDEMAEHTGTLTLRGTTEGAWREWTDEHPPRDEHARDKAIAYGVCNADDLLDALDSYAVAWNGENLSPGDWEWIVSTAAPGDLKSLVQLVIAMHETTVDVPKLLSGSLATLDDETA
jgi:hypothetical protein